MTRHSEVMRALAELRSGDGNGCKTSNATMRFAAEVLQGVYEDSITGQNMHARWQERAEKLETAIRDALGFQSVLPQIATVPRRILEDAL